jgi:transposase InsO family protein
MLEAVPYQVHIILTQLPMIAPPVRATMGDGIQFAELPGNRNTIYSRPMRFDMICEANGIEHRLTKPNHPWSNDQVERPPLGRLLCNRLPGNGTARSRKVRPKADPGDRRRLNVKRFHYGSHDQLRSHLADFLATYNFAHRLKTLSGLTPYEYIRKIWTSEPDRFILDPIHQMPGLNN